MELSEMREKLSEIEGGLLVLASKIQQPRAAYYMDIRTKLSEIRESLADENMPEEFVRKRASEGEGTLYFVHGFDLYEAKPAGYSGSGRVIVPLDRVRQAMESMVSCIRVSGYFTTSDVKSYTQLPINKVLTIVNTMLVVGILTSNYHGRYIVVEGMSTDVDEWIRIIWALPDRIDVLDERQQSYGSLYSW